MIMQELLSSLRSGCSLLEGPPLGVLNAGRRMGQVNDAAAATQLVLARPNGSMWEQIQVVGDSTGTTIELVFMPPDTDPVSLGDLISVLGQPTELESGFDVGGRTVRFSSAQLGDCGIEARLLRAPDEDWKAVMLILSRRGVRR